MREGKEDTSLDGPRDMKGAPVRVVEVISFVGYFMTYEPENRCHRSMGGRIRFTVEEQNKKNLM